MTAVTFAALVNTQKVFVFYSQYISFSQQASRLNDYSANEITKWYITWKSSRLPHGNGFQKNACDLRELRMHTDKKVEIGNEGSVKIDKLRHAVDKGYGTFPAAGGTGAGLQHAPQRYGGTKSDKVKSHLPESAAASPRRTEMNFSSASFDFSLQN